MYWPIESLSFATKVSLGYTMVKDCILYSPFGHLIYWFLRPQTASVTRTTVRETLLYVMSNRSAISCVLSWVASAHRKTNTCFSGGIDGLPKGFPKGILLVFITSLVNNSAVVRVKFLRTKQQDTPAIATKSKSFSFLRNLSISSSQLTRKSQIRGTATLSSILFCCASSAINQWNVKCRTQNEALFLGGKRPFHFNWKFSGMTNRKFWLNGKRSRYHKRIYWIGHLLY